MRNRKIKNKMHLIFILTFAFFAPMHNNIFAQNLPEDSGLGDAASSMLDGYSPDVLMDDLVNSPFLSQEDKDQLANMSPEEQDELFGSVVDIFNDPEFQKILNDPTFIEEMEKLNEMIESGDLDYNDDLYKDTDNWNDFNTDSQQESKNINNIKQQPKPPAKSTIDECKSIEKAISSIIKHLHTLEQKGTNYEFIKDYFGGYKSKVNTFIFYLEMLQKKKNLELLTSDDYASLNRDLYILAQTLENEEPQIPLDIALNKDIYNPYEILGIPQSSSNDEIKERFKALSQEKKPSNILERLQSKKLEKNKIAKKMKKAELKFAPIKKAHSDLLDKKYRKEIDRIINAEKTKRTNIEELTQLSIWNTINALDEAINSPGTTLSTTEELLKKFDEKAVEERKKREEEEARAAKRVAEFGRKVGRPSPVPREQDESYFGGYPYNSNYGRPERYRGSKHQQAPDRSQTFDSSSGPKSQRESRKPDSKKIDNKKLDGKKPGSSNSKDKPSAPNQPSKKPDFEGDDVVKSIKKLDDFLNSIEKDKKDIPKKDVDKPEKSKDDNDKEENSNKSKKEEPKKGPEKPEKPSKEDIKKLENEFDELKAFLTEDKKTKSIKNIDDAENKLKTLFERLDFRLLKNQLDDTQKSIAKFNKIKNMHPQIKIRRIQEHKKAFEELEKNHKMLIGKLKEIAEINEEKTTQAETKRSFFGFMQEKDNDDAKFIEPTYNTLNKIKKNIDRVLGSLQKMKLEIDPQEKKKQEEAQKKNENV